MNKLFRLFILVFFLFSTSLLNAQEKKLELNKAISGKLAADGEDYFTLEVDAENLVFGYVNQISVDVVVKIEDPDGKRVRNFDDPARGKENFYFEATKKGTYKITVESFKENKGAYSITILKREPKATDPAKRIDQLFTAYDNDQTPGAAIGAIQDGKPIFAKAYGMACPTVSASTLICLPI